MPPEEQQVEAPATDTGDAGDAPATNERQALIDAVNGVPPDASGNDNPDLPTEPAGAAKPKVADPAAPAESEDPGAKIAAVVRAREQSQKTREDAKTEAQKHLDSAKAQADRIIEEARAEARKVAEAETAAFRAKWRDKPLRAIEEAGIDKRVLLDDVSREGSAEWQAQRRIEAALDEVRAENKGLKEWQAQQAKAAEAQEVRQRAAQQATLEKRFLEAIPAESPLRELYDDAEILQKTYAVAALYREAKGGEVASDLELRHYLEAQAAERLARIRQEKAASTASAAKTKANGPRTPSASSASERRASPKPGSLNSDFEEREAQKKAADDAMSAYAKT